jgi:hypothetical protein
VVAPNRGGYPPGPLLERIDFERQADELAPLLDGGATWSATPTAA